MRMDPNIVLSGQTPDPVGSAAKGVYLARGLQEAKQHNALTKTLRQHGAGLLSGDEEAFNALAGIDPAAALDMQQTHQQMGHAERKSEMEAVQMASKLSAAEAKQAREDLERGLRMAASLHASGDQAGFDALMGQYGLQVPFDEFEHYAMGFADVWDALVDAEKRNAPPVPMSPAGKLASDFQSGLITQDQYDAATTKGPLVDMSGMNLGTKGETEYDKERGKSFAAKMEEFETQGAAARRSLYAMDAMEEAMQAPGFYSGIGANAVTNAKRLAVSLGMDADGIADMEAFNSQAKAAALDAMGGSLGAGFSNADRDFVEHQVAGLGNTPDGNRKVIEIQRKLQQRKIDIMLMAQDYERKHGRLNKGFSAELNQWAEENPLFENSGIGADIQQMDMDALMNLDIDSLDAKGLDAWEKRYQEMSQ